MRLTYNFKLKVIRWKNIGLICWRIFWITVRSTCSFNQSSIRQCCWRCGYLWVCRLAGSCFPLIVHNKSMFSVKNLYYNEYPTNLIRPRCTCKVIHSWVSQQFERRRHSPRVSEPLLLAVAQKHEYVIQIWQIPNNLTELHRTGIISSCLRRILIVLELFANFLDTFTKMLHYKSLSWGGDWCKMGERGGWTYNALYEARLTAWEILLVVWSLCGLSPAAIRRLTRNLPSSVDYCNYCIATTSSVFVAQTLKTLPL